MLSDVWDDTGSEQLNNPMQCTVAYTGRVVVVDRGNHRLQTISFQTGRSSTIPLSGTSDPIAVQVLRFRVSSLLLIIIFCKKINVKNSIPL